MGGEEFLKAHWIKTFQSSISKQVLPESFYPLFQAVPVDSLSKYILPEDLIRS